jgi:hypothetical protein
MRMKIGSATWDCCEKCVHFDDEHGCKDLENLIFTEDGGDILCVIGQEASEPEDHVVLEVEI